MNQIQGAARAEPADCSRRSLAFPVLTSTGATGRSGYSDALGQSIERRANLSPRTGSKIFGPSPSGAGYFSHSPRMPVVAGMGRMKTC